MNSLNIHQERRPLGREAFKKNNRNGMKKLTLALLLGFVKAFYHISI